MLLLVFLAVGPAGAATRQHSPPPPLLVTGQDAGWPDVRQWIAPGVQPRGDNTIPAFAPYPTYQSGVRVAIGDVTGDGRPEIVTSPGRDAWTMLGVFDGRTFQRLSSLSAFAQNGDWWGGAFVATGDTNGDGRAEIVEGLDAGCCTSLRVIDAATSKELGAFFPYTNSATSGARVAAGDIGGDGTAEVMSAPLNDTRVSVFSPIGGAALRSYSPFGPEASGGAAIAAGNVSGDARVELVAAAVTSSGAQLKVLDTQGGATLASFLPFGSASVSSLEVATADVNGDRRKDVLVLARMQDGTQVKALDISGQVLASFFVVDPTILPGASLAAGDLDGDGKAEIVLGSGPTTTPSPPTTNGPDQKVAVFEPDGSRVAAFSAYPGLFLGGVRVALGDVDGDHDPEIVTAPGPGMAAEISVFDHSWSANTDRGNRIAHFLAFEPQFTGGASVAVGDVDRDGTAEIVVGPGPGRPPEVRIFDSAGKQLRSFMAFEPTYQGGISVAAGDLNADGRAEIVVVTLEPPARIRTSDADGLPFGPPLASSEWSANVGVADLAGDGRGELLVGADTQEGVLVVLDPLRGAKLTEFKVFDNTPHGIRVAGGDLNGDGRDEIVVARGWGAWNDASEVRIYDRRFALTRAFAAYDFSGVGMNVAVRARIGLPIAAEPRTVKLVARTVRKTIVARFRDAGGGASPRSFRARIEWGDGTSRNGLLGARGSGVYEVSAAKRYARPGRYAVRVTLTGADGRKSIARSTALVRSRR